MTRALLVALLCCLLPAAAQAQDDAARDADIFGEPEATPEPDESASRDDDIFGGGEEDDADSGGSNDDDGESDLEAKLAAKMAEAEDRLAIGGQLYPRVDYELLEDGKHEETPLLAPTLFDLYFDGRPNDRVRVYARGRLTHDFAASSQGTTRFGAPRQKTQVVLDQLWLKFDVYRQLFVTVGKQQVRWGTGRFWNPTDFINTQFRDPLLFFDPRLGVGLVKLHLPVEAWGWNFYLLANIESADKPENIGPVLRAELLFGTTELALTASWRHSDARGLPNDELSALLPALQDYTPQDSNLLQLGAAVSSGIWWFDLKAEFALRKGDGRPYFAGSDIFTARLVDRRDDWIPQLTLGAELSVPYLDNDSFFVGAEYFYNDAGVGDRGLYPLLLATGTFQFLYVGRHYGALYALFPSPGNWDDSTFTGSVLANLSDRSFLARVDYRVRVLTWLDTVAYVMAPIGRVGELNFGSEVAGIAPAWLQLGMGFIVAF